MTLDSSRPRSTSTGAAAVDHKARQDSVDGGAREHTTGDAGARHAQEIARTRARTVGNDACACDGRRAVDNILPASRKRRPAPRARRRRSEIQTHKAETAGHGKDLEQRPFAPASCAPRQLQVTRPRQTHSLISGNPVPHTTRVGTPSVPLFPLASPAVRRATTAPLRLHPPAAAAAGASEQRPGHESSAVSGAVDRSHSARAAELRRTHNATDRVQQRMISRTFALPALCVR